MRKFLAAASLIVLACIGPAAHANGLPGQRLETTVGTILIDVGTDLTDKARAGAPIQFDFAPLDARTRDPLTYSMAEVTIAKDGATLFHGDLISADAGPTLLTYTFFEAGTYDMRIAFYDQAKKIVEGSLPAITVAPGQARIDASSAQPIADFSPGPDGFLHLRKAVGQNIADISIDQAAPLSPGRLVRFTPSLTSNVGDKPVHLTDIDVLISSGDTTSFEADVPASASGTPGVDFAFPTDGVYRLIVGYYDGDSTVLVNQQVARAEFPPIIVGHPKPSSTPASAISPRLAVRLAIILGTAAAAIVALLLLKKRK